MMKILFGAAFIFIMGLIGAVTPWATYFFVQDLNFFSCDRVENKCRSHTLDTVSRNFTTQTLKLSDIDSFLPYAYDSGSGSGTRHTITARTKQKQSDIFLGIDVTADNYRQVAEDLNRFLQSPDQTVFRYEQRTSNPVSPFDVLMSCAGLYMVFSARRLSRFFLLLQEKRRREDRFNIPMSELKILYREAKNPAGEERVEEDSISSRG